MSSQPCLSEQLLNYAISTYQIHPIEEILQKGADPNSILNESKDTALHIVTDASSNIIGDAQRETTIFEITRLLISYGADVDSRNIFGETPLINAAEMRHYTIVRLLLQNGAELFATNNNRLCALANAAWYGNCENIQELLNWGAGNTQEYLKWAFNATFWNDGDYCALILIKAGLQIGLPEAVSLIHLKDMSERCAWRDYDDLPDGVQRLNELLAEGGFTQKELKEALKVARRHKLSGLVTELKKYIS